VSAIKFKLWLAAFNQFYLKVVTTTHNESNHCCSIITLTTNQPYDGTLTENNDWSNVQQKSYPITEPMSTMDKFLGFTSLCVSAGVVLLIRRLWAPKSTPPQTGPDQIFKLLNAQREAFILKAALELKIFSRIAELGGKATIQDLVRECKASERGMTILMNALVVSGYLKRSESRFYENTKTSLKYLVESSDQYVGHAVEFYLDMNMLSKWNVLKKSVIENGYSSKDATDEFNPM
jgi:hypothetical protein